MISQTSRYALHILGHLVRHRDERVRGEVIAQSTRIPANYLSKILNQLRKRGLVDARKGWGGGFQLRPEAFGRPLLDVLVIFEGDDPAARNDCVLGLPACDEAHPCPLHDDWKEIRMQHQRLFSGRRVEDLATDL